MYAHHESRVLDESAKYSAVATRLPGANPRPARRVKETLIPALPLARTRNMKGDAGDSSDQVGVGPKNTAKMH